MAVSENLQKILDSTTGYSNEFKLRDNRLTFRLKIDGVPNANIKAFFSDKFNNGEPINACFVKAYCSDWGTAKLIMEVKTSHLDDEFSSTGDEFTKNQAKPIYY